MTHPNQLIQLTSRFLAYGELLTKASLVIDPARPEDVLLQAIESFIQNPQLTLHYTPSIIQPVIEIMFQTAIDWLKPLHLTTTALNNALLRNKILYDKNHLLTTILSASPDSAEHDLGELIILISYLNPLIHQFFNAQKESFSKWQRQFQTIQNSSLISSAPLLITPAIKPSAIVIPFKLKRLCSDKIAFTYLLGTMIFLLCVYLVLFYQLQLQINSY